VLAPSSPSHLQFSSPTHPHPVAHAWLFRVASFIGARLILAYRSRGHPPLSSRLARPPPLTRGRRRPLSHCSERRWGPHRRLFDLRHWNRNQNVEQPTVKSRGLGDPRQCQIHRDIHREHPNSAGTVAAANAADVPQWFQGNVYL
ncbi:hypothetical protein DFH08DRAFT_1084222, partial [Mycena albidolilacea]